jgi:hypothetical protein
MIDMFSARSVMEMELADKKEELLKVLDGRRLQELKLDIEYLEGRLYVKEESVDSLPLD